MPTIREGNDSFAPVQLGMIVEEIIDNPAAGAEISYVAPVSSGSANAEIFRILGLTFVFVTDAVAGDRNITLEYRNVGDTIYAGRVQPPSGAPQVAGTTFTYIWMPNQPFHEVNQNNIRFNWLPAWWLIPGQRIGTLTDGLGVADQYSNIVLMLQRWKAV